MIELKVDEWCQNCPDFEAKVEKEFLYNDYPSDWDEFGEARMANTTISCENRVKCARIRENLANYSVGLALQRGKNGENR
jgi:hypothetical protein